MPTEINVPVLVGTVPLLHVQSMTVNEGYRIQRIASSKFSQALGPTTKTINIVALLLGPERLLLKKSLEALALASRLLVARSASALGFSGIPVVSGLTISLDMQITDLRFSQSVQKRDALDVRITLQHVPRSNVMAILGESLELALAVGTTMIPTASAPSHIARTAEEPL